LVAYCSLLASDGFPASFIDDSDLRIEFTKKRFVFGQGFALFIECVVIGFIGLFELLERFALNPAVEN